MRATSYLRHARLFVRHFFISTKDSTAGANSYKCFEPSSCRTKVALKKIKTLNLIVDDHGNFVKGPRLDAILIPRVEQPHVGNDLVEKQREIEEDVEREVPKRPRREEEAGSSEEEKEQHEQDFLMLCLDAQN